MNHVPARQKGLIVRLFIFKSETRKQLLAFAGDPAGSRLPQNHGPWTATGIVGATSAPPHNISRDTIEEAIETNGFQLWRMAKPAEARA
jgi:hypothetical protein